MLKSRKSRVIKKHVGKSKRHVGKSKRHVRKSKGHVRKSKRHVGKSKRRRKQKLGMFSEIPVDKYIEDWKKLPDTLPNLTYDCCWDATRRMVNNWLSYVVSQLGYPEYYVKMAPKNRDDVNWRISTIIAIKKWREKLNIDFNFFKKDLEDTINMVQADHKAGLKRFTEWDKEQRERLIKCKDILFDSANPKNSDVFWNMKGRYDLF